MIDHVTRDRLSSERERERESVCAFAAESVTIILNNRAIWFRAEGTSDSLCGFIVELRVQRIYQLNRSLKRSSRKLELFGKGKNRFAEDVYLFE